MEMEKHQRRFMRILDNAPEIKAIFLSEAPLEEKRVKILGFLARMQAKTFSDDPGIPPLEWVLARDAIQVFRSLISTRSERLAGYSFLSYLDNLLHRVPPGDQPLPHAGFFNELEHLIRGIVGKTGIYPEKAPGFLKLHGARAARLRSADLSRMSAAAQEQMARFTSGLENETVRRRSRNKARILKHFDATDLEWEKWQWHVRNAIQDAETLGRLVELTADERRAVEMARQQRIPFGITPYYLSLMDYRSGSARDRAVRAQVIPPMNYVKTLLNQPRDAHSGQDFMLEHDTSPIEGITRRYPEIVILKPILTCPQICVYCQRNWEIEEIDSTQAVLSADKLQKAIEWIADTPEIQEVLITGGDPLLLSNSRIEKILYRLSKIDHVVRIRIGTRTPVTLPQRITDTLVRSINRFHIPGKREIIIITHFEHPYEISPQAMEAVQKFRRYGIDVYNQMVYTFYNSKKFEAAALRKQLRLIGVTPYYTFNAKGKEETDDYRVPIARLLQEQHEEARLLPGTVRTDEIVFNVPRLGKNYLRARQHHDVVSILPDGRRVYEFHPWEKKLFLVDTYTYTDVSIHRYLQRMKAAGENITALKTIWYYY
ncbi:MAG: KamA family radical SAM protein [Desulfobacterales bacterium]|nr:KamA family radical SAM protein [Desulfobacterales bacterium]